jgi:hypothetical protein
MRKLITYFASPEMATGSFLIICRAKNELVGHGAAVASIL